jgi:hypothetical protein
MLEQAARAREAHQRELAELRRVVSRRGAQAKRLFALVRRREQRLLEDAARAGDAYERELEDLRRAASRRTEQAQRLLTLVRRREQRLVDGAAEAREGLEHELAELRHAVSRRGDQARRLYVLIRRREERLAAAHGQSADADDESLGHVLYVQLAGRYELIESDGPAPEPGSILELGEGERAVVGWIGRSPLPGDRRRCAFAQQSVPAPQQ